MHLVIDLGQSSALRRAHDRRRMCRTVHHRPASLVCYDINGGLGRQREPAFKQFTNLFIRRIFAKDFVPAQNAPRIRIHNEHRMISGIEENGIGSLWTDAIQIEQLFAQPSCGLRKHSGQRSRIPLIQELNEELQPSGFLPEVSRGPNQALQGAQW